MNLRQMKNKNKERRYRLPDSIATLLGLEIRPDYKRYTLTKEQEDRYLNLNVQELYSNIEHSDEYKKAITRELPKSKYYLITSCQAETPIHEQFFDNMLAFAKYLNGEIIVHPSRYKNPTSLESNKKIKEQESKSIWNKRVQPYLYAKRLQLNKHITVLTDLKVQPTAKLPLSGLNGFTGDSTSILPHPKVQLETVAVLPTYPRKLLLTTGSVSLPNYTDTKIGAESLFQHEIGFALVEVVDEEKYFVHQVIADDTGSFYFLDKYVSGGKVEDFTGSYPATVFGDIHYGETDHLAYYTSIMLANRLNVKDIFLHDVGNLHSISHHDLKSPTIMLEKEESGDIDLKKEVDKIIKELINIDRLTNGQIHIVESNHPLWIDLWVETNDWRCTPNKRAYLEYALLKVSGKTEGKGILNYLIEQDIPSIKTYTENDSLKIHGYEMLIHGHRGASGSKGSINQYKSLNTKGISAHSHTATRIAGWLTAGTLTTLTPKYVKGLSKWIHSNVLIAPNGKATHIHIINGKYSTL